MGKFGWANSWWHRPEIAIYETCWSFSKNSIIVKQGIGVSSWINFTGFWYSIYAQNVKWFIAKNHVCSDTFIWAHVEWCWLQACLWIFNPFLHNKCLWLEYMYQQISNKVHVNLKLKEYEHRKYQMHPNHRRAPWAVNHRVVDNLTWKISLAMFLTAYEHMVWWAARLYQVYYFKTNQSRRTVYSWLQSGDLISEMALCVLRTWESGVFMMRLIITQRHIFIELLNIIIQVLFIFTIKILWIAIFSKFIANICERFFGTYVREWIKPLLIIIKFMFHDIHSMWISIPFIISVMTKSINFKYGNISQWNHTLM